MRLKTSLLTAALLGLSALVPHARAQEPQPAAAARVRVADPNALRELLAAVEGPRVKDADAWHQLGIEYNLAGDPRKAREAFKRALKLRSNFHAAAAGVAYTFFAEGKLDEALRVAEKAAEAESKDFVSRRGDARPDFVAHRVHSAIGLRKFYNTSAEARAQAEAALAERSPDARWHFVLARALIGMSVGPQHLAPDLSPTPPTPPSDAERATEREGSRKLLTEAASHLEEYLRLSVDGPLIKDARAQLEALRYHAGLATDGEPPLSSSEVTTKAVIVFKPEPGYTEHARKNNTEGLVRLRAVLAPDGTVRHLLVVKPLDDGLTEKALQAARRIRFRPAVKDGRPVPQTVHLEYNFNVY